MTYDKNSWHWQHSVAVIMLSRNTKVKNLRPSYNDRPSGPSVSGSHLLFIFIIVITIIITIII